jgi:hypothetical protein
MRLVLILLAVALNVALAAQIVSRWSDPRRSHWQEPAPVRPAMAEALFPPAPRAEDLGKYRESIDRPLFSPTRRPVINKKGADADKPKVDALKEVKVTGLYGGSDRGGAIISVSGKLQRLAYGAKIADWKLVGEKDRSADFVSDEGEHRLLKLERIAAAPPPPSTPVAAVPQKDIREPIAEQVTQPARPATVPAFRGPQPETEAQHAQRIKEMTERVNKVRAERGLPLMK